MSWLENIEKIPFKITTGDSNVFTPLWISGQKSKEFNFSKYDFISLKGSIIDRKESKSTKYPLVFYFQGENNLQEVQRFERSAEDKREWRVDHPFYGIITGQPLKIDSSDKDYNVSVITVDFWETINVEAPLTSVSIADQITEKTVLINNLAVDKYVAGVELSSSDVPLIRNRVDSITTAIQPLKESSSPNLIALDKSINDLTGNPKAVIENVQVATSFPENTTPSDLIRFAKTILERLFSENITRNEKVFFESQSASTIANLSEALILQTGFITRSDVENASFELLNIFENVLANLDIFSVDIFDVENSWSPNIDLQTQLRDLVFLTLRNLFSIAFEAKQERVAENEKDSNLILLAHKYMGGLDVDDAKIESFREINNIINDELLHIPKGRKIIYYV